MAEEKAQAGGAEPQKSARVLAAEEEVRRLLIAERRRKIAACRALRIVLQLAKRRVTADFLCLALNFIEPQHWDDAIDERNAEGLCGYVFCSKKPLIMEGKKQRYRICCRTNQVYDMEDYNRFCSVWCAKAARHVRAQIADSSVAGREGAHRLALTFLEKASEELTAKEEEKEDMEEGEEEETNIEMDVVLVENETAKSDANRAEEQRTARRSHVTRREVKIEPPAPRVPPLDGAKAALRSWITADSLTWLEGRPLSSASDDEAAENRGKVRRFFARRRGREDDDNEEMAVKLPLVDSVSQDAIRRRIVGAKLDVTLRDLAPTLRLDSNAIRAPVRQLLRTFSLTAGNIVLRPQEWCAVTVLLLQMISRRDDAMRDTLDGEEAAAVARRFAEDGDLGLQALLTECAMLSLD